MVALWIVWIAILGGWMYLGFESNRAQRKLDVAQERARVTLTEARKYLDARDAEISRLGKRWSDR